MGQKSLSNFTFIDTVFGGGFTQANQSIKANDFYRFQKYLNAYFQQQITQDFLKISVALLRVLYECIAV